MPSWITICETCKREDWAPGCQTDGARLADLVQAAAGPDLRIRRVSCTMGCERACNIIVQGRGKIGYSLGRFEGTAEDAAAILAYARMHADSATGQVPFRDWPQGVRGHFVSRHLPLPEDDA